MSAVGRLLAECSTDELPTPTTSSGLSFQHHGLQMVSGSGVDARIVMSDGSQRQAWLQTNVVVQPLWLLV